MPKQRPPIFCKNENCDASFQCRRQYDRHLKQKPRCCTAHFRANIGSYHRDLRDLQQQQQQRQRQEHNQADPASLLYRSGGPVNFSAVGWAQSNADNVQVQGDLQAGDVSDDNFTAMDEDNDDDRKMSATEVDDDLGDDDDMDIMSMESDSSHCVKKVHKLPRSSGAADGISSEDSSDELSSSTSSLTSLSVLVSRGGNYQLRGLMEALNQTLPLRW